MRDAIDNSHNVEDIVSKGGGGETIENEPLQIMKFRSTCTRSEVQKYSCRYIRDPSCSMSSYFPKVRLYEGVCTNFSAFGEAKGK